MYSELVTRGMPLRKLKQNIDNNKKLHIYSHDHQFFCSIFGKLLAYVYFRLYHGGVFTGKESGLKISIHTVTNNEEQNKNVMFFFQKSEKACYN